MGISDLRSADSLVRPAFFRWELRTKHPVIDLSLFKNSTFTNANLSVMLSNLMMYAVLLIMPLFMTSQFGLETSKSGMALSVFSIFMSASNWVGAQLHNKWGARKVIFLSFAMMAGANILFLLLSQSHSIVFLMVSLILGGLASGVGLTSMQVSSLSTVDAGMSGTASGIFSTFRYFGSITSSALIGLISGFHILFIILIGVSVIGIFVSLGIKPAETASVQKFSVIVRVLRSSQTLFYFLCIVFLLHLFYQSCFSISVCIRYCI